MNEVRVGDLTIKPQLNIEWRSIHPAIGVVDDTAYVGVWVPSEIFGKAGLSSVKRLLYLVTSSREMILANEDVLRQRKWALEYKPIEFQNRWSLKHVQAFLDGASVDPCETLERLLETYRLYVELPSEAEYAYHTLWDVGTYFHHLFNAYPYVYVGGVKRSGKTKLLTIHSCLAFNAFFSNNMSTSSIYRLIQNAHGTLLIDETEKLSQPERALEFRSILLAGYKKGQKVYRCEKTRRETIQPEAFDVYGPKGLANIQGLEDVLEDRCKNTILKRSRNISILNREINVEDELWSELRNRLYILYLNYWREVKEIYNRLSEHGERSELVNFLKMQASNSLEGRDLDHVSSRMLEIWKPIFALALFFDSKGFALTTFTNSPRSLSSLMHQLSVENAKARIIEDMTETGESLLTQVLLENVREDGFYKVKALRENMARLFDEEQKWLTTKWVANALKRLGFIEKRRVGTGYEYKLRRQEVQDLAARMGVEQKEEGETESLGEILEKAKDWIATNKDEEGLINVFDLTEFLSKLTDKPNGIIEILKNDGQLFPVGSMGKLGVK